MSPLVRSTWDVKNDNDQCAKFEPDVKEGDGKVHLSFDIFFGEQLKKKYLFGKEIKFAILEGELWMTLDNGTIVNTDFHYARKFPVKIPVIQEVEKYGSSSNERKLGGKLTGTLGIDKAAGGEIGLMHKKTFTHGRKERYKARKIMYFIQGIHSKTEPRWKFSKDDTDPWMYGLEVQLTFAAITPTFNVSPIHPLHINYEFHVEPKNVIYTSIRFWDLTESVNKITMIKNKLTKRIFGNDEDILCYGRLVLT